MENCIVLPSAGVEKDHEDIIKRINTVVKKENAFFAIKNTSQLGANKNIVLMNVVLKLKENI